MSPTNTRAPIATGLLLSLALASLWLHLLSSGALAYGYMSDEFYYLDCAARLAWGYVDHPPFSLAVLKLVRATLGDALLALRFVPALLGSVTVVLVGLLARELGGGRSAQGLAALATAVCPAFLGVTGFYSMNAFDLVFWALAALLLAHLVNTGNARLWLWLGFVLGLGLLNKISMSWFGLGLAAGLVLTPKRRWLATPWPWAAAAIALALFAPHLFWQAQHDWPTLEFMRNATRDKMVAKSPVTFVIDQLVIMHPLFAPFWIAGLVHYFRVPEGRRHQIQAWIWISVFLLLMARSSVRATYLGPAYASLLAAGGVTVERIARSRHWDWFPAAAALVFAVGGLAAAPLAIPLLPPKQYIAYERSIGLSAPVEQKSEFGAMPLHYALRFGWSGLMAAIEEAHATLTPEEQTRAVVFGSWFGDTGAVNFFGPDRGLPNAISGHNNYWLWGPGGATGEVVLVVAETDEWLSEIFVQAERVAEVDCEYCMPDVARLGVYVCRGLRRSLGEIWQELKLYQ